MTIYVVRKAINEDPSILRHWGEDVEISLSCCYQDRFDVGDFETDQEAIAAVKEFQEKADELAGDVAEEYGLSFDFSKLPRYTDHLYRKRIYGDRFKYQKVNCGPERRGGKRPNAGVKPSGGERRKLYTFRLNTAEHAIYQELGGIGWLRNLLAKEIKKRAKKSVPAD